jgi:hypothetical protein
MQIKRVCRVDRLGPGDMLTGLRDWTSRVALIVDNLHGLTTRTADKRPAFGISRLLVTSSNRSETPIPAAAGLRSGIDIDMDGLSTWKRSGWWRYLRQAE